MKNFVFSFNVKSLKCIGPFGWVIFVKEIVQKKKDVRK